MYTSSDLSMEVWSRGAGSFIWRGFASHIAKVSTFGPALQLLNVLPNGSEDVALLLHTKMRRKKKVVPIQPTGEIEKNLKNTTDEKLE